MVSFNKVVPVFILLLSLLFNTELFTKERDQEMGIVLVAVGEIDRNVIDGLRNDLNKIFNKQVFIGKGMPEPKDAFHKKETSIYLQPY